MKLEVDLPEAWMYKKKRSTRSLQSNPSDSLHIFRVELTEIPGAATQDPMISLPKIFMREKQDVVIIVEPCPRPAGSCAECKPIASLDQLMPRL
jgi:hypothetical protein